MQMRHRTGMASEPGPCHGFAYIISRSPDEGRQAGYPGPVMAIPDGVDGYIKINVKSPRIPLRFIRATKSDEPRNVARMKAAGRESGVGGGDTRWRGWLHQNQRQKPPDFTSFHPGYEIR